MRMYVISAPRLPPATATATDQQQQLQQLQLPKLQQNSNNKNQQQSPKKKKTKRKSNKMFLDSDARGLERRAVQRNGKDKSLGRIVLCGPNDLRQLCAV